MQHVDAIIKIWVSEKNVQLLEVELFTSRSETEQVRRSFTTLFAEQCYLAVHALDFRLLDHLLHSLVCSQSKFFTDADPTRPLNVFSKTLVKSSVSMSVCKSACEHAQHDRRRTQCAE